MPNHLFGGATLFYLNAAKSLCPISCSILGAIFIPTVPITTTTLMLFIYGFQDLASILYKAAKEGGYVDPKKVAEILGISEEDLFIDEKAGSENEDDIFGKFQCF